MPLAANAFAAKGKGGKVKLIVNTPIVVQTLRLTQGEGASRSFLEHAPTEAAHTVAAADYAGNRSILTGL